MKNCFLFAKTILFFLIVGLVVTGCKHEEFEEVNVSPVATLYIPEANEMVVLQTDENASVYFEWEKATAEDNGVVYYDVLFDKEDGDFSNPVYSVMADNRGTNTGATVSHIVLNRAAGLAGIPTGATGVIKWTVRSSRGLTYVTSQQSHNLMVTRTDGLEPPTALYLTGEATENGTDLQNALSFRAISEDEFEIFTRLTAGADFKLLNALSTEYADAYYIDGDKIREGDQASTVDETAIYRIYINFPTAKVELQKVNKVEAFICTAKQRLEMTYQNNGMWKAENVQPDFKVNWDDDRYFYYMQLDGTEYKLGSVNKDNQAPSSLSGSYFDIGFFGVENDQWNYSFKVPADMRGTNNVTIDMILYLNSEKYTNEIVRK